MTATLEVGDTQRVTVALMCEHHTRPDHTRPKMYTQTQKTGLFILTEFKSIVHRNTCSAAG